MARQSACRVTEIADQRIVANSQKRIITSKSGLLMSSTSRFPLPKKITSVPSAISSGNSARMMLGDFLASASDSVFADMGASISSPASSRNENRKLAGDANLRKAEQWWD